MAPQVPPPGAADTLGDISMLPAEAVEPLVAHRGLWVHHYHEESWVRALGYFAHPLPETELSADSFYGVLRGSTALPWAIFLLGLGLAIVLPAVLRCCHPKLRSPRGGPPWKHFLLSCALTVAVLGAAAWVAVAVTASSFGTGISQLRQAATDIVEIDSIAKAMNASGTAVLDDLARLRTDCPGSVQEYFGDGVTKIITKVSSYCTEVERLSGALEGTPAQIMSLEGDARSLMAFVLWFLAGPWLLVLACCAVIVAVPLIIEHASGSCQRRCERFELPCVGLGCVAPAIVAISVVAAIQLLLGISLGGICASVDATALRIVEANFPNDTDVISAARYYLVGEGPNPAIEHLDSAQADIFDAISWVRRYGDEIARTCPQWELEGKVVLNLEMIQYSMNQTETILAPDHLYPFYETAVHETLCESLPAGLGRAALLQVALALLCLPTLLCTASCVLDGLVDERTMTHGLHKFDLLAQESDGDGP